MNLFQQVRTHIDNVIAAMITSGELSDDVRDLPITVEPPRDASHGDMSTNVAMVLAGKTKSNPRALAEKLVEQFKTFAHLSEVTIAGPGFINFRFQPEFWQQIVPAILSLGEHYGDSDMGAGHKVNVEYVSANPTGPLHIGHARGAVYGDALALLLKKSGHRVTKEYYVNDAGSQVDTLARSAFLRYRQACGEEIGEIPQGLYPGDYLIPTGHALKEKYGDSLLSALSRGDADAISIDQDEIASSDMAYPPGNSETFAVVKRFTIDAMLDLIRGDLQKLGIAHDVFTS